MSFRNYQKYVAVIHKDKDSAYGAYFPDLPGCFAAGDTEDEALENLRISLRMYADDLMEDGKTLPAPRMLREVVADHDVRAAIQGGYGFIVLIPLLQASKKRRVNVSLDPSLIAAVDEAARIAGTNRSDFLASVAWRELEAATGAVKAAGKAKKKKGAARAGRNRQRRAA
jgi:predicted RNase H-like HicB family nuclease